MEAWLQITLLLHTEKVRLGNFNINSAKKILTISIALCNFKKIALQIIIP